MVVFLLASRLLFFSRFGFLESLVVTIDYRPNWVLSL